MVFRGFGGSGGGLPGGNEGRETAETGRMLCGNITDILMGSASLRLESLSLGLV